MARQETEPQSNQLNLTVVALVALVAIVGLVALVMNAASLGKVATGSQMASASEMSYAQAHADAVAHLTEAEVNVMGEAIAGLSCTQLRYAERRGSQGAKILLKQNGCIH